MSTDYNFQYISMKLESGFQNTPNLAKNQKIVVIIKS